jgi:hypothetical protein
MQNQISSKFKENFLSAQAGIRRQTQTICHEAEESLAACTFPWFATRIASIDNRSTISPWAGLESFQACFLEEFYLEANAAIQTARLRLKGLSS